MDRLAWENLPPCCFDQLEHEPIGHLTVADTDLILEANPAAAQLLGYSREALSGRPVSSLFPGEAHLFASRATDQEEAAAPRAVYRCEGRMTRADGSVFWAELTVTPPHDLDGRRIRRLLVRDISNNKQAEAVVAARVRLLRAAGAIGLHQLLQSTLDEAEALTGSSIGFCHFLGPDQTTVTLHTWSSNTLGRMCQARSPAPHSPINQAGVWSDCLRERRPVIHNDYASLPHRHGLPPGHPPLERELVVPILRDEAIVAVLAVGNKPSNYTAQDVAVVATLADLAWDIADRKRAEEALRESEKQRRLEQEAANSRLREQADNLASIYQALDSVGLIVTQLDENDARIIIFNSGAEHIFGWSREEAVGQSIALIYPPESIHILPSRVAQYRRGQPLQSLDMTLIRRNGQCFPSVLSVHPFDCRDGRYHKAIGVFRDISELKCIQTELEKNNQELERRVEERTRELQEAQKQYLHAEKLSAIGKLSASIAHEFNNPLQSIMAILKGLKKRAILEEEDRILLDAAIVESDRIKELIRSLQDFYRPTSGRTMLMDVHKALDSILLLYKNDFRSKRITLERDYAKHLPQIMAVPDQIKQVFLNLLTNAADACQRPGGTISVRTRQEGDRVIVAVSDTGIGIKPGEMDRIFQPFYTTKPEVRGTGLGLSISYGIIKSHGGEIRVASQPHKGSTFTLFLPLGKGGGEPNPSPMAGPKQPATLPDDQQQTEGQNGPTDRHPDLDSPGR